jgi:hypothetical protein
VHSRPPGHALLHLFEHRRINEGGDPHLVVTLSVCGPQQKSHFERPRRRGGAAAMAWLEHTFMPTIIASHAGMSSSLMHCIERSAARGGARCRQTKGTPARAGAAEVVPSAIDGGRPDGRHAKRRWFLYSSCSRVSSMPTACLYTRSRGHAEGRAGGSGWHMRRLVPKEQQVPTESKKLSWRHMPGTNLRRHCLVD